MRGIVKKISFRHRVSFIKKYIQKVSFECIFIIKTLQWRLIFSEASFEVEIFMFEIICQFLALKDSFEITLKNRKNRLMIHPKDKR